MVSGALSKESRTLSRSTLLRVFWRSLFLQASWNPEHMQSLGLTYALYPALTKLYPNRDRQKAALERHLDHSFNTHPYVAAAIVGGILHYEQRIVRGDATEEQSNSFKDALMGPLAALGDGFFWHSLKPAAGAVAAATVPFLHIWSAALFLILYNSVHLTLRARFFYLGYRYAEKLVAEVRKDNLPTRGIWLRRLAAVSAGGAAAIGAARFGSRLADQWAIGWSVGCLGLAACAYVLSGRDLNKYLLWYGSAALAIIAGALL